MSGADWQSYLRTFHGQKPGVTEQVLSRVEGSPYAWLAEPLHDTAGWIVDVACGSAPTRDHLAGHRWVGVDLSSSELTAAVAVGREPVVQARADALPFVDGDADAVCAAMALQVVTPLPDVLAEIGRVLVPSGVLAALVPSRLGASPQGLLGWTRMLGALGFASPRWPNPHACDRLAGLLSRHGFQIVATERRTFWFPVDTGDSAALLVDSLYLPGISADRLASAKQKLGSWARPGRRLALPLRRVIARH